MSKTSPSITLDTTVSQAAGLMSEAMDKEVVMMVLEKSAYYSFDEIGSHIWRLMENPVTVQEICDRMQTKFDVSPAQCQADVLQFLNEIQVQGLIETVAFES